MLAIQSAAENKTLLVRLKRRLPRDPRILQILTLSGLLAFGMSTDVFDIPTTHIAATLTGAMVAQLIGSLLNATPFCLRRALSSPLRHRENSRH